MGKKSNYYTPTPFAVVPGVTHKPGKEHSDSYHGEAQALVASGLVTYDMLPKPGSSSICWRPIGQAVEGQGPWFEPGYMRITPRPAGGFLIVFTVSREEQAARQRIAAAQHIQRTTERDAQEAKERADRAMRDAERQLASLPTSHAQFRERVVDTLQRLFASAVSMTLEMLKPSGYSLSDETEQAFVEGMAEAFAVISDGDSVLDRKRRAATEQALRAVISPRDEAFPAFMACVMDPVDVTEPEEGES